METLKYYTERLYPYILAGAITLLIYIKEVNFIKNTNMNSVIDGVNTIAALIIGFLGAILPVILGMKNESKIVKYVFEKDENKLFLKYIKSTIVEGLMLVFFNIMMYFRTEFSEDTQCLFFRMWIFLVVTFLLLTCRCLLNMLNLIFMDDSGFEKPSGYFPSKEKTKEEEMFEDEWTE